MILGEDRMKRKIAEIIDRFVHDGKQIDVEKYDASWEGNMLFWTENEWENTFEWDGSKGKLTYHAKAFELDNYEFNIMPFISDDMIYFNGPADLGIRIG